LVGKVTVIGGQNPFSHDVEFNIENLSVPGHHVPGKETNGKGLSILLNPGETIHQHREIAHANVTKETTEYQETYPEYPTLDDLRKNTFEDSALQAHKIKHNDTNPHPVVDYYEAVIKKKLHPDVAKKAVTTSADNKNFVLMDRGVFEKTVSEMRKSPIVSSKLNNMSNVADMKVHVVPSEPKGDVSRLFQTKPTTGGVFGGQKGDNTDSSSTKRTRFTKRGPEESKRNISSGVLPGLQTKSASLFGTRTKNATDYGSTNTQNPENATSNNNLASFSAQENADFSQRSWINSAKSVGQDVTQAKQAFVIVQVQSIPASKIKNLRTNS